MQPHSRPEHLRIDTRPVPVDQTRSIAIGNDSGERQGTMHASRSPVCICRVNGRRMESHADFARGPVAAGGADGRMPMPLPPALVSRTRSPSAWLFIVVASNLVKLGCHEAKVMPGDQSRIRFSPLHRTAAQIRRRARPPALAGRLRVDRSRSFNLLQACMESISDDRTASRCPDRVGCSRSAARPLSDPLSNRVWSRSRRYQQAVINVLRSIVR